MIHLDNTVHIRRASQKDLQLILDLENKVFSNSDRFTKRQFKYLLASSNVAVFICFYSNSPIGYSIVLIKVLRNLIKQGRIYSLGVLKQHRRKSVGELLLKSSEQWAYKKGASFITLETRKGKSGVHRFFHKFNYKIINSLPKYYGNADGIRMRKTL